MKIGIVGSRTRDTQDDFTRTKIAFQLWLNRYSRKNTTYSYGDIQIVSGGQKVGADGWAEQISDEYEYPMHTYKAPWRLMGRSAGPIRNVFIARDSDALIACFDGSSAGTQDCINKFKKFHPDGELIIV